MAENQFGTLTDDQLVELAKSLIEDHDELKDQNVTNDDMVKILSNVINLLDLENAEHHNND